MNRLLISIFCFHLFCQTGLAQGVDYKPGGKKFSKQWNAFYKGDHEPELPAPLVSAGKAIVPSVCEAVSHPDMRMRRYAISALGSLRDKRAISTLVAIVNNVQELDYFRGDALEAIYKIDRKLGVSISNQYSNETNYLKHSVATIQKLELKASGNSK